MSTLENAAAVLEHLDRNPQGCTETEVRVALGLPKATMHRLMASLTELGMVRRVAPGNQYMLGPAIVRWGSTAMSSYDLRSIARPILESLRDATTETAHLGVLDRGSVLYLDLIESPHAVRMLSRVGGTMPIYSTAMGKCLLAALSVDDRDVALAQPLVARTPQTITNRQALVEALERIASDGFALDEGENEVGVTCVAAPVRDHSGTVVAAVSVSTPDFRLPSPTQHLDAVRHAARAISAELGYLEADSRAH